MPTPAVLKYAVIGAACGVCFNKGLQSNQNLVQEVVIGIVCSTCFLGSGARLAQHVNNVNHHRVERQQQPVNLPKQNAANRQLPRPRGRG